MHFTALCISSVGIYDVSWWSNFPSSTVCFFTLLPCAKYPSTVHCYAWQGYKTGLGLSPEIEGCVWQYLWQEDGFRCADLTCLQLSGFARPGLAQACSCVPVRDSHPPLCRPRSLKNQMPCCQFPLSCNLASPSECLEMSFFFLTCALYQKPQLQCPQQLQSDAGLRSGQGARFCTCGMWHHTVFPQVAGVPMALFSASLQPKPARTHVWEPLASWDLKPLAHVITQTRVCWQPQPLPASLSGALGHDLLVLWVGCD